MKRLLLFLAFLPTVALADCVPQGTASKSVYFVLRKTADNTELTGKVAADMTAYYTRSGAAAVAFPALTDLAAVTTAYTSGGVKAIDGTNQPGLYRIDVPDAAWASGTVDSVVVSVKVASAYVYFERFELKTACTDALGADGVLQSATSNTATLATTEDGTNSNIHKNAFLMVKKGRTIMTRRITGYTASSKKVTVSRNWDVTPDSTYSYYIIGNDDVTIGPSVH